MQGTQAGNAADIPSMKHPGQKHSFIMCNSISGANRNRRCRRNNLLEVWYFLSCMVRIMDGIISQRKHFSCGENKYFSILLYHGKFSSVEFTVPRQCISFCNSKFYLLTVKISALFPVKQFSFHIWKCGNFTIFWNHVFTWWQHFRNIYWKATALSENKIYIVM